MWLRSSEGWEDKSSGQQKPNEWDQASLVNVNTLGFTLSELGRYWAVGWLDLSSFLKIRIILVMVSRIDCRTEMDPQGDKLGVYFNCPRERESYLELGWHQWGVRSASSQVISNACYCKTSRHWSGSVERPMGSKCLELKREKQGEDLHFGISMAYRLGWWDQRNALVRVDVQSLKPEKL